MSIKVFAGAGVGLFVSFALGAAFIAVWFTKASDLWSKAENLWEGLYFVFESSFVSNVLSLTMSRN
jgi:high-affinity iron transporter